MIITTDIQLFRILKERLGEKEAEALVDFVDAKLKDSHDVSLKIVATKEDLLNLKNDLQKQISENKAEMIKWMFIFWIGQIAATFGFIIIFLKNNSSVSFI